MATHPVVLYDANVLYPAQLRNFLMRLAVNGLVRAHWSAAIHAEWMRNVHADYPDIPWKALERTRRLMDALPDALVEGYQTDHKKPRSVSWQLSCFRLVLQIQKSAE